MEGNRSRVGWRQTRQCPRERLKTVRERDGKVDTLLRERRVWIGNTDEWEIGDLEEQRARNPEI